MSKIKRWTISQNKFWYLFIFFWGCQWIIWLVVSCKFQYSRRSHSIALRKTSGSFSSEDPFLAIFSFLDLWLLRIFLLQLIFRLEFSTSWTNYLDSTSYNEFQPMWKRERESESWEREIETTILKLATYGGKG